MKRRIRRAIAAAAAVALAFNAANAAAPALNSSDHAFLTDALGSNQLEIDVSAYTAGQADSAKVKQFAQTMATEHSKLAAEMQKANDGIVPPPARTPQPGINLLGRQGAELDHAYVDLMVAYEREAIIRFKSGSEGPQYSAAIHDMAKAVLPSLQRDEATAKAMQQSLGPRK